jgi:hypothetical protein
MADSKMRPLVISIGILAAGISSLTKISSTQRQGMKEDISIGGVLIKTISQTAVVVGTLGVALQVYNKVAKNAIAMNKLFQSSFGWIGLAITALTAIILAVKNAIEAKEKAQRQAIESTSDEVEKITTLTARYKELKAKKELDASESKELRGITESFTPAEAQPLPHYNMKGNDPELAGYINEVYDLEAVACDLSVEKKDERKKFEEPFIQEFCTYKLAVNY